MDEAPTPAATPLAHATPPAHVATGLALLAPLALVIVLLAALLAAGAGAARWMLVSPEGTLWLLAKAPGIEVRGFRGALLGERWQADRLRVSWAGGTQSVTIEGLAADGLRWAWRPHDHAWLGVQAQHLSARKVTVLTGPPSVPAPTVPASLNLPLQVTVAEAQVDTLLIDTLAPMTTVSVQDLKLQARPAAEHTVARAGFDWQGVRVAAHGRIATSAPLALAADATLLPALGGDAPPWAAVLRAGGDLSRIELTGTLRGVPRPGRPAPAVDLQAGVRLFQPWPLDSLKLRTEALDLAAITPGAPETRLSGTAELSSKAAAAPLAGTVTLTNALPGRWNEGRLPLQRGLAELRGMLARPDRIELGRFELDFADASHPAGRWSGSGLWQGHELSLQTQLLDVTPQRLDGRTAAMKLSGPVAVKLLGLPSPDPAATSSRPPLHAEWKIDLTGTLDAAPQPVRLALEGSADGQRLELTRARATSGSATAELQGLLTRTERGPWTLQTAGKLADFDPLPWWPGGPGSAWRKGPHRLTAGWKFELRLPAEAAGLAPLALAQRLAGNGHLEVHDSVLAGVPLAADLTLAYDRAGAPARGTVHGELHLGGNQLVVDGRGDPAGPGQGDHLRGELNAQTLATLAPLARLLPGLADRPPRQGSASASFSVDGRWPALRTEGSVLVQQLQAGTLTLARGQATWRLDSAGEQPLSALVELNGGQFGARSADLLRAELHGTLAEHRIDIAGALPLAPPPLAAQLLGVQVMSGTQAQMQAQGAWHADPGGGGHWRARIERLLVGAWDGGTGAAASAASTAPAASAAGWVEARDLKAELQFAADGGLLGLHADPGRVLFGNGLALRWDEVRVDLRGEHAGIELHADIEPFAVAPLLVRAQPTMGWQGDLRLAARVDIRAAERFDAEVVLERRDGDLQLVSSEGLQVLGLTELRFALAAHDGTWVFSPLLRGRSLGELTGSARVQTTPEQRWPPPDAAVEGSVLARAADIGIWGTWVPPGWRLTGELRTGARIDGRFGEPRYTGEITGNGLGVRNLLQGVNISDGQVAVRLAGDTAQIERCTLRGGDGTLTVTGGATLGGAPQARLRFLAEHFRVLGRVDRTVIASGAAELSLRADEGRLDGSFTIDEGLFDASRGDAPTLDDDVTVRRAGDGAAAATDAAAPRPRRNFVLGVEVDLGEKLRLRGRGLDTALRGRLKLTTPGGRLAVNGSIDAADGTYAAYGQKLAIERGIVAFSGQADNPRLDVLALRPNIDTRVGVSITGTLLTPRVRLYSDPELSDADKLSWLVLGRAPDGLGRNDTALLQRAAVALLSGEGEAPTDALMKSLGIDELSLHQGDSDVRETVVSLGKQLSRRWYLGYERGVNATTGTWQLVYRIAQRFTLRAQSGLENALDVIWVWRAQETPADAGMRKSRILPP